MELFEGGGGRWTARVALARPRRRLRRRARRPPAEPEGPGFEAKFPGGWGRDVSRLPESPCPSGEAPQPRCRPGVAHSSQTCGARVKSQSRNARALARRRRPVRDEHERFQHASPPTWISVLSSYRISTWMPTRGVRGAGATLPASRIRDRRGGSVRTPALAPAREPIPPGRRRTSARREMRGNPYPVRYTTSMSLARAAIPSSSIRAPSFTSA